MSTAKSRAANARKAEASPALAQDVEFEYEGQTYTIEADRLNNLELFEAIEDEKYLQATRGFLGDAQWAEFKDSQRLPDGRVPMECLEGFLAEMVKAIGQGNSSASSGS